MQSTLNLDSVKGVAGQLVYEPDAGGRLSKIVQPAAGLAEGLGITQGTAADQGDVVNAAADVTNIGLFLGCTLRDPGREQGVYKQKEPVSIVRRGFVFVSVEQAVVVGDQAFCRYASGAGGTVLGAWRKDADTATAAAVAGAYYRTATSGAGIAVLELNLP